MAETQTATGRKRISPEERFRYIGFDVFPGKPGEIFKSDSERTKLVAEADKRRNSGNTLRDDCKLLEERVSGMERTVLTVAAVVMVLALFLPFYRSNTEQVVQKEVAASQNQTNEKGDEIITATQTRRDVTRTFYSLTGIGSVLAVGDVGGKVFGSGIILILTGLILFLFTVACIAVPVMILREIYTGRGTPDERAMKLKKKLRIAWAPLLLFVAALFLSLLGSGYGFDPANGASYGVPNGLPLVTLGSGYSVAAFLGTVSFGVYVALAASILLAIKGVEI